MGVKFYGKIRNGRRCRYSFRLRRAVWVYIVSSGYIY